MIETAGIALLCVSIPLLVIMTVMIVKYWEYIEGWIAIVSFGAWIIIMSTALWFGLQYWKYIHLLAGCVGTVARGTDEDIEGVFRAGIAVGSIITIWAIAFRLMRGSDSLMLRFGVKEKCKLPSCCFQPIPPADTYAQSVRRSILSFVMVNLWYIMVIAMCAGAAGLWTARTSEAYDKFEQVMGGRVAAERSDVPIFVGEFGTDDGKKYWFQHTVEYIRRHELHWAYWAIDGQKVGTILACVCVFCACVCLCQRRVYSAQWALEYVCVCMYVCLCMCVLTWCVCQPGLYCSHWVLDEQETGTIYVSMHA